MYMADFALILGVVIACLPSDYGRAIWQWLARGLFLACHAGCRDGMRFEGDGSVEGGSSEDMAVNSGF